MNGQVLNQIIIKANYEMSKAKDKLLVEESGRIVASLQGHVAGYSFLISSLAAEFHLPQYLLEDTGDDSLKYSDLSDEMLLSMRIDQQELVSSPGWSGVTERIDEKTVYLKDNLLYNAEKSRDLDVSQGFYKAMEIYKKVFESIEYEVDWRDKKNKEDKKATPLFHQDDVESDYGVPDGDVATAEGQQENNPEEYPVWNGLTDGGDIGISQEDDDE